MTNSSQLSQKKLGFSLEQIITFAKLTYEVELISDNQESKPILYSMLCQCTKSFREVLNDQYIQVRTCNTCEVGWVWGQSVSFWIDQTHVHSL